MIFAVIVALLAAAITASADLSSIASLDVARVMSGELWRLLSGHLAHLTWRQYLVDAAAFIVLYATYSRKAGCLWAALLSLFAALFVSMAVVMASLRQVYGGLSGLSCAAVSAILLATIIDRPRQTTSYLILFIYCLYLLFMGGMASGVNVAREAHIAGAVSGVLFVLARVFMLRSACFLKARTG